MIDIFENYIASVSAKFFHEETSEMGYRADFEILLKQVFSTIKNAYIFHDAKSHGGNKPDFIVLKDKVPLLYLEVKDVGTSLDKIEKSEQMSRYFGYANLILSDYLEFRFYRNGLPYGNPIKIAEYDIKNRIIIPTSTNYEYLAKTLVDFIQSHKEPIRSANHLAKIMGGKGQRLRDNVRHLFEIQSEKNEDLEKLYKTIKELLVTDLTPYSFADMYAQTLVYGLFVARYHDNSLENFTRLEARELIPNSNRFLKRFFDHIVGAEFKSSLRYIVDELCEVFSHADVAELMKEYFKNDLWGETHKGQDPVIHFYEDFLEEYDPGLRKKMGAYYTPLPVVQFIIRSIDEILKKEFNLPEGLADATKNEDGVHRVQILDPAVGTGTFLTEIIETIYKNFQGQEGRWPGYVHADLLPRLYGFEIMMTPYTIAHLKLGIQFRRKGFWDFRRRLGIYLTNSLEESSKQQQMFAFGLAESIAEESKEAAEIKDKKPIMVVLGNPPYSVSSSNKSEWIQDLIKDYKVGLNEQKLNLDDDYIKFIRLAEHFVEKNKSGIVAMITNNSFIDGVTHRQMRKHLLQTFDEVFIFDLHGSLTRKEKTPDEGKDENVFDIQQGVAISLFVKKVKSEKKLGTVYHADLFGKRKHKFEVLNKNSLKTIKWEKLHYSDPYYFFVPKDFRGAEDYERSFRVNSMFDIFGPGVKTERDKISVHFKKSDVERTVDDFKDLPIEDIRLKYQLPKDSRDWSIERAKSDVTKNYDFGKYLKQINYRPFDSRWTYYTGTSKGFIGTPGQKVMKNVLKENVGLVLARQFGGKKHFICFISNKLIEISSQPYAPYTFFPLYQYLEDGTKVANLKNDIVVNIERNIGKVSPENILDYIYAVLYSPSYREKYKEFLKIDFPRVPYPKDKEIFTKLVKLGTELRQLHLLESSKVDVFITTYPITGSNAVEKIKYEDGKVWFNEKQYFGDVPEIVWNFWIGGYQPAQKWLKDRKGRILKNEDIEHYQKMIIALVETDRTMKEIDKISLKEW